VLYLRFRGEAWLKPPLEDESDPVRSEIDEGRRLEAVA
jgi:hypothetical protein